MKNQAIALAEKLDFIITDCKSYKRTWGDISLNDAKKLKDLIVKQALKIEELEKES